VDSRPVRAPESILIIKPSSLGDAVHTLPAVALLKRCWPEANLRWLINPEWAPLLDGNPHVDEVVIFPRGEFRGLAGLARIPGWAKTIAQRKADLVLDFQGLFRSALIGHICRRGDFVGLSDAREGAGFFYTRAVDVSGCTHAVDRYLRLVATLGIDIALPLEWPLPVGSQPADFNEDEPFILLHPFSRGEGKSLTADDATAFCRELAPRRVVLAGRGDSHVTPASNLTDLLNRTSLAELIWLIRHAEFVVSVDSGPMHIAAALTSRLVSIHTWSDPAKVGPYRPDAWVWKGGELFQMRDLGDSRRRERCPDIAALAAFVSGKTQDPRAGGSA
jgi:ADP-heptose:LPS heptosyltransferase